MTINTLSQKFLNILYYICAFTSVMLIVITLASLIHDISYWYLQILDFPRIQYIIIGLICLMVLVLVINHWRLANKLLLGGLIMSIAIQLIIIFPYTTFSDTELSSVKGKPEVDDVFSILVANVWMKNNNYTALLNIIEKNQPDIVIALEVNAWWLDQIKVLESRYNYVEKKPFDNTYGMALYSKLPLKNTRILYLNHEKVPSIHTQVIMNSNKEFNLHVVHPVPPKPSNHPDNVGEKEIALVKVGNMVVNEKLPSVVAGDFNDVAWSKTSRLFKEEGQLNDIRVGRGIYNTFNAKSWILRWPLDHVYVTSEFKVVEIKRLNKFGSDHFPFWVSLAF